MPLRGGQSAKVRIAFVLDFHPATVGAVGSESNELQVPSGRLSLRRCGLFGSAGFREACYFSKDSKNFSKFCIVNFKPLSQRLSLRKVGRLLTRCRSLEALKPADYLTLDFSL